MISTTDSAGDERNEIANFRKPTTASKGKNFRTRTLPFLLEKEIIQKHNRNMKILRKFMPPRKIFPIQDKFYSKYSDIPPTYEKHKNSFKGKPNTAMPVFPVTESQMYGWFPRNVNLKLISQLNSNNAPKVRCDLTSFGEKLFSEKHTERNKFNGLRFFLR